MSGAEKDQDARDKIQNWLMSEGWNIAEQAHPELAWLIRALGEVKRGPPVARALVLGGLAAWTGFVANGLVEWNLGDLEVVTLFWSVMGLAVASVRTARGGALDRREADSPRAERPNRA